MIVMAHRFGEDQLIRCKERPATAGALVAIVYVAGLA
jgi:hypothetical protein